MQWLDNNTPYDPKVSEERQAVRSRQERLRWIRNLLLIGMQVGSVESRVLNLESPCKFHISECWLSIKCDLCWLCCGVQVLMQLPSVLCLLRYSEGLKAGSINFETAATWAHVGTSEVAIYFYIYAGSSILFQTIGFLVSPISYMRLAASINVAAVVMLLWSVYIPQAALGLYLAASVTAATWGPINAYIFLDGEWTATRADSSCACITCPFLERRERLTRASPFRTLQSRVPQFPSMAPPSWGLRMDCATP